MTHFSVKIVHTKICMNNETSQQTIQFCVLFQEQNINLHDKSIYQLPRILHGKTLNIYIGVHLHTLYEPIIVNLLTCDVLIPINRSFTC